MTLSEVRLRRVWYYAEFIIHDIKENRRWQPAIYFRIPTSKHVGDGMLMTCRGIRKHAQGEVR